MTRVVRYIVRRTDENLYLVYDKHEKCVVRTHEDATEAYAACGTLNYRYNVAHRFEANEQPYTEYS